MTTTTKIVLGLIGAAAVGAAVGLLLAPSKGSELRENIKNKAGEWADNLGSMFNRGKEELDGLKEDTKKRASRMQTEM
jgi:gas vesicle protein